MTWVLVGVAAWLLSNVAFVAVMVRLSRGPRRRRWSKSHACRVANRHTPHREVNR